MDAIKDVIVGMQHVDVGGLKVLGSGGEGLVVLYKGRSSHPTALKIYHAPTRERERKLKAFFARKWNLPLDKIALPIEPVYNDDMSLIVGLSMPYLGAGIDPIAQLSNKNRMAQGLSTKTVAEIFLDGHHTLQQIHANGLVVGDLRDQNVFFKLSSMLWIDVDAWQFGNFPCPVAKEDFVDPLLYGTDFTLGPAFKPENDWFSFAVVLFRSLMLVHPFGGTHKVFKEIKKRAVNRITVLDPDVKKPKIALSPDILSDDLAAEFESIFKRGMRHVFSEKILQEYLDMLIECPNCKTYYPHNRKGCPVCNQRTMVVISRPVVEAKNVKAIQFFTTTGNIVYSTVLNETIYVISTEHGKTTLHVINQDGDQKEFPLPVIPIGSRLALTDEVLVVNPKHANDLLLYNYKAQSPSLIYQTVTDAFAPSRKAAFQVTANKVLRVVGREIVVIEKGLTGYVEKFVHSAISEQTWFAANSAYNGMQLLGLFQILQEQKYWYFLDGKTFEPLIAALEPGESLVDISVKFSHDGVCLRRKTKQSGVDYLRVETVDNNGGITFSSKVKCQDHPAAYMHGQIYSNGSLLHATDAGLVQEKVATHTFKTFTQTEPFVKEADTLFKFKRGVVAVGNETVTYIELT